MNTGKLVFAQVMTRLPLSTLRRCVARYNDNGEYKVKHFTCLDRYLCTAFAQLVCRESLPDIEACLCSQTLKLYHLGFNHAVARDTLGNANAMRGWRIHADFAQSLISMARRLYVDKPFGVDSANMVYALDATTIDSCLPVFAWTPFRNTKAAVNMRTLLRLRGDVPRFIPISDSKWREVDIFDRLESEAGAFYAMDRGVDFAQLRQWHQAASFFVIRAKAAV